MISQRIKPAIEFIDKETNLEKKFQIKIEGLPLKIKKIHIEKLIVKLLKAEESISFPLPQINEEGDLEKQTNSKIIIEKDKKGRIIGRAWFQSSNRDCLKVLLKLHKKKWIEQTLKTFLMGFTYDDELDGEEEEEMIQIEKWA